MQVYIRFYDHYNGEKPKSCINQYDGCIRFEDIDTGVLYFLKSRQVEDLQIMDGPFYKDKIYEGEFENGLVEIKY